MSRRLEESIDERILFGNIDDISFRGSIDPDMRLIWLQMRDCLRAYNNGDEIAFANCVMGLLANIPYSKMMEIEAKEEDYITEEDVWVPYVDGGTVLSSDPDNPLIINRKEDLNYDPDFNNGEPLQISPIKKHIVKTDYYKIYRMIQRSFEDSNLRWPKDPRNVEYGLYPTPQKSEPSTPISEEDLKKNPNQDPDYSHHMSWVFFEEKPVKVMNFRGYAVGIGEGEKPWFFNEIATSQTKQEPIVILITGTQGKGKTYCGIRLAQIFDKKFDPEKQIVMDRNEIMYLVSGQSNLKRDQAIIVDESQFGAGARSWGSKDQQILMNFLAAARFHGYIIIIVALHRSMLDNIIRNRIINYHLVMENRGTATVYENRYQRFDEVFYPKRRGVLVLRLPDYDRCPAPTCLTCKHRDWCMSIRAIYERKKLGFVTGEAEKQENKVIQKAMRERSDDYYIPILNENWKDLDLTQKNYVEPISIRNAIQNRTGETISMYRCKRLRSMIHLNHKEIIEKLIERKQT